MTHENRTAISKSHGALRRLSHLATAAVMLPFTAPALAQAPPVDPPPAVDVSTRALDELELGEVLRRLQRNGVRVVFSDLLVRPWMRSPMPPTSAAPEEALLNLLTPFGLRAVPGPGSTWLVVRSSAERRLVLHALYGIVTDASSGARVANASVRLDAERTTHTDNEGQFVFYPLSPGDYDLAVNRPGYRHAQLAVRGKDYADTLRVSLEPLLDPELFAFENVRVEASRYDIYGSASASHHFLNRQDLERVAHIADDSNRALHRLPGVVAGDWSAKFHVRGGLDNEVGMVMDGLELFDPFHLAELFSPLTMIDANIIENMELYSGGFAAEYGGYSSGIVNIETLSTGAQPETEVGVSFVNAFARSHGSFDDYNGDWLVSLRRGYLDLIIDRIPTATGEFKPRYYDMFAKASYQVSDRLRITGHLLAANDNLDLTQDDGDVLAGESRSAYAWITLDGQVGERLHAHTILSVGDIDEESSGIELPDIDGEYATARNDRRVRIAGAKSDWSWLLGPQHLLKFGAEIRNLDAHYDYELDGLLVHLIGNDGSGRLQQRASNVHPDGDELGGYLSYRLRPHKSLVLESGLRYDKQTYTDLDGQSQWSPRFNLLWQMSKDTDLRLAWGRFVQPQRIDELQVEDGVETFWPAQKVTHQIVSLAHRFSNRLDLRIEAYRKEYTSVVPRYENVLNPFESVAERLPDRLLIAPTEALARGMELTFTGNVGEHFDWWAAYTFSHVTDRIDGERVRRSWDHPHNFTAVGNWQAGKWNANVTWTLRSGRPSTALIGHVLERDNGTLFGRVELDALNDTRLKDYNRVDLRIARAVDVSRGEFRWFVDVYNVFDTQNECCVTGVTIALAPNGSLQTRADLDKWLPRMPSIGFSWVF